MSNEYNKKPLKWINQCIFYGLILLPLYPLFRLNYIFTHDGPAHIYNACLIKEIISGNALPADFLHLKIFPEPNWTGHFFLAVASVFFRPNIAEKIFLGAYIFLFPFFFRKLVKKVNPESEVFSFLVFPFIYSYFFFGGLYNFLAGLTVLFAALSTILPLMAKKENKKYFWIFIFSILLYFSHLVALCVFLAMLFIAQIFCRSEETIKGDKKGLKGFIIASFPLLLALLPSLILLTVFLSNKLFMTSGGSSVSISEMMKSLFFISPVITLQFDIENIYSLVLLALFVFLLFMRIIQSVKKQTGQISGSLPFYRRSSYWMIACLLMLAFFFFIPDQAASGGVIKFRFELIFFLMLAVYLAVVPPYRFVNPVITIIISGWMLLKLIYFFPMMKNLNDDAETAMRCTVKIRENSILLPLNYSSNWMHCNLFNYAGTVKNIFVLDNYEAGMPHFPLEWKKDRNPVAIMGNFNIDPPPLCADVNAFEKQTHHNVDYIVVWKYQALTDSCTLKIQSVLSNGYHLIYSENDDLKLYQINLPGF